MENDDDNDEAGFEIARSGSDEKMIRQITFLYTLTRGFARHSYGLNVARLAQVPSKVLRDAQHKSQEMQKNVQLWMEARETASMKTSQSGRASDGDGEEAGSRSRATTVHAFRFAYQRLSAIMARYNRENVLPLEGESEDSQVEDALLAEELKNIQREAHAMCSNGL